MNSPAPSFTCRRSVTTPDLSHTSPPQPKQFNQQNKTVNTSRPEICIKPFKRLFGAPCWSCDVFPSQGICGFSCFWTLFVFIDCLETAKRGFAFFAVSRHFWTDVGSGPWNWVLQTWSEAWEVYPLKTVPTRRSTWSLAPSFKEYLKNQDLNQAPRGCFMRRIEMLQKSCQCHEEKHY